MFLFNCLIYILNILPLEIVKVIWCNRTDSRVRYVIQFSYFYFLIKWMEENLEKIKYKSYHIILCIKKKIMSGLTLPNTVAFIWSLMILSNHLRSIVLFMELLLEIISDLSEYLQSKIAPRVFLMKFKILWDWKQQ